MSRVIVKVSYHNPRTSRKSVAGYANYIATREGVEKREQNVEDSSDTTYADYIATRPGVEKRGNHGLFSIENRPISLSAVSDELKGYKGNVWTVIVSLKGDDGTKTGFDNSEAWRELITDKANDIAKCFGIPIDQLNCYAAFHNEREHPHIHMIVYSKNPAVYRGYHSENSLQKLKSSFTREIFKEELSDIYKMKDKFRDDVRQEGIDKINKLADEVRVNKNISNEVIDKFKELSDRLSSYSGKKTYGYLPKDIKELVDEILKLISQDDKMNELYNSWYEMKEQQQGFYNSNPVNRVPIEQNKEFTSIKNAIVREAYRVNVTRDSSSEEINSASTFAVGEILELLCMVYCHAADQASIDDDSIIEQQSEVDKALGIKHS